ncbi:putative mg-dependent DNase, partial [Vibrio parahaemolyticus VPCR-2009]
SYLH